MSIFFFLLVKYIPLILRTAFSHALQCKRTFNSTTCHIFVKISEQFCLNNYVKQTNEETLKNIHTSMAFKEI